MSADSSHETCITAQSDLQVQSADSRDDYPALKCSSSTAAVAVASRFTSGVPLSIPPEPNAASPVLPQRPRGPLAGPGSALSCVEHTSVRDALTYMTCAMALLSTAEVRS